MKVFNEEGEYIGELIEDFIDDSKDKIEDAFDDSVGNGCAVFLYMLPWIILVVILLYVLKLIWIACKFLLRILWWLIRAPFMLIFSREWPEF